MWSVKHPGQHERQDSAVIPSAEILPPFWEEMVSLNDIWYIGHSLKKRLFVQWCYFAKMWFWIVFITLCEILNMSSFYSAVIFLTILNAEKLNQTKENRSRKDKAGRGVEHDDEWKETANKTNARFQMWITDLNNLTLNYTYCFR